MHVLPAVSVAVMAAALACGQAPVTAPEQQQPGSIEGRVVNALTGDLVPGATVNLRPLRARENDDSIPQSKSQADGSFSFAAVAPGSYVVFGERDQFLTSFDFRSALVELQPGQTLSNVVVKLTPEGTISGKVLDENGKPVPRAQVSALVESHRRDPGQLTEESTSVSDANGTFNLAEIRPGAHYLMVGPPPPGGGGSADQPASPPPVRTFYPRALAFDDAGRVDVGPGQSVSDLTITMRRAATAIVRGKIVDPPGMHIQRPSVSIAPRSALLSNALSESVKPATDGTFTINGVLPGAYTLRLRGGLGASGRNHTLLARQDLDVGANDVNGISLAASPPINLEGRVTADAPMPATISHVFITARPSEDAERGTTARANAAPDGTFALLRLDPTLYLVSVVVNIPGYYLKSVTLNQQDITNRPVDLSQVNSGKIEVLIRRGTGEIDGTIRSESGGLPSGNPSAGGAVVLIPEQSVSDSPSFSYARQPNSSFVFGNVPPGRYRLYAVDRPDPNLWENADFLHEMQNLGAAVEVTENSRVQLELERIEPEVIQQTATMLGLSLR